MKIIGIIPARFASTRFEGKPLVEIDGKSMIQRTYEQAAKCTELTAIWVATDDERIFNHVKNFGGNVIMTADTHPSGTDRIAEALRIVATDVDAVINIQGDEPFIQPAQIEKVAAMLRQPHTQIATLAKQLNRNEDILNPNIVKVVFDANGKALYFSRSPIPYMRGVDPSVWVTHTNFYKHIGLYGYQKSILFEITKLSPSRLELAESLEQLRWLEAGFSIQIGITDLETIGIDTPEDLQKISCRT